MVWRGRRVGFVALGFNFFWSRVLSIALLFFLLQQTFSDAPWTKKVLVFQWCLCDGYISFPMGLLNSGTFEHFLGFCSVLVVFLSFFICFSRLKCSFWFFVLSRI